MMRLCMCVVACCRCGRDDACLSLSLRTICLLHKYHDIIYIISADVNLNVDFAARNAHTHTFQTLCLHTRYVGTVSSAASGGSTTWIPMSTRLAGHARRTRFSLKRSNDSATNGLSSPSYSRYACVFDAYMPAR